MRTLSHSTQWRKGPYCLTSLIVKAAHISEPACQGPGFIFFFFLFPFLLSPSLFLNFFPFLYFILYPTHCPTPLTRTSPHRRSFLSLLPRHLSALPLSPPVSPFSKWWVLTYDRLSQVCFNYCKGDGDSTGEEEGKTFVRTLYLSSGG